MYSYITDSYCICCIVTCSAFFKSMKDQYNVNKFSSVLILCYKYIVITVIYKLMALQHYSKIIIARNQHHYYYLHLFVVVEYFWWRYILL
jgi:hypothetical protein